MYEELKEMLNRELKEVIRKGELSPGSLEIVDKLTHSLKSLTALEGNSYRGSYGSYEGSYARRGRDGDGDGRYSEESSRGRSYESSYRESRDGSKQAMIRKLEMMMDDAVSENDRLAIMDCLKRIG